MPHARRGQVLEFRRLLIDSTVLSEALDAFEASRSPQPPPAKRARVGSARAATESSARVMRQWLTSGGASSSASSDVVDLTADD